MSDSFHALTVALEYDMSDDDVEHLSQAIGRLKGVLKVKAHVNDFTTYTAIERARFDLGQKLLKVVFPEPRK